MRSVRPRCVDEVLRGCRRRGRSRAGRPRAARCRRSRSRGTRGGAAPRAAAASRSLVPTYPMIPHISTAPSIRSRGAKTFLENAASPATRPPAASRDGQPSSAFTSDAILAQRLSRLLRRRRLREHADDGLRAGRPHEHAPVAVQLLVDPVEPFEQRLRQRAAARGAAGSAWPAGSAPSPRPPRRGVRPCERAAQEQRRGEAVAGDVVAQADDVPGLLAAEDAALAVERLEHVAVADVGRETRMPRSSIRRWKPRFVIVVTATRSTPRSSARIATIWSPSTAAPFASTASIRSPSPSNATPRSKPPLVTSLLQARRGRSRRSRR